MPEDPAKVVSLTQAELDDLIALLTACLEALVELPKPAESTTTQDAVTVQPLRVVCTNRTEA